MRKETLENLNAIEKENNVRIFYAVESGSRAWGFESTDSDYDVRFLYIHPRDWYLTIDAGRDVIEQPISDQLDICGWDIKKALLLFRKSNPPLLEWLSSPIIYIEKFNVAEKLRTLTDEFYSPIACLYHYLHMAQGNYRDYLQGETVWIKKYFYLLRPILACKWIEKDLGPVPMRFEEMVNKIITDDELKKAIDDLIHKKKQGQELGRGPRIPMIGQFIEQEICRLESAKLDVQKSKGQTEKLNQLFLEALEEIWNAGIGKEGFKSPIRDIDLEKKHRQGYLKNPVEKDEF